MIGHFANKFKLYFWIAVVLLLSSNLILTRSYADQSIEELANSGLLKSQGMASSEGSGEAIPNYSKSEVENEANNLDNLDDAEIRTKSEQKISTADSNSAEGITRDSNQKKIEGFENQEIFTKADKINEDPIAAFERMTNEGCKEKENQQKPHYKKTVKKEKVKDEEIYEEICEKPAGNIICEKTLNVSCEATEECQAGGIELGSVESGTEWEYNYPNIRFGSRTGSWHFICPGENVCCKKVQLNASFKLRDISEIRAFNLRRISFDDHAMIKVNGSVVYNSWGGYKLDITDRRVPGDYTYESNKYVDAGNGNGGKCFQFYGKDYYRAPNVDLRSYLREGRNEIEMTLVYAQYGQFNIEIEARQQCCTKLTDKWEKRCWEQ